MTVTTQSTGRRAYEAYFMARDGDAGLWDDLTDEQRECWEAAGEAAAAIPKQQEMP